MNIIKFAILTNDISRDNILIYDISYNDILSNDTENELKINWNWMDVEDE